jgi:hypothetical protein
LLNNAWNQIAAGQSPASRPRLLRRRVAPWRQIFETFGTQDNGSDFNFPITFTQGLEKTSS